ETLAILRAKELFGCDHANVLAMGGRSMDHQLARRILDVWLDTPFEGGRHARRVALIEPGEATR
ncbi:MAG TPA: RpiB/LacA/LacB family sugar-phosphate isomerase, partial [Vicinamibacteria bacterium]|nr:RpiB/LacA/LacB family sugar-phosphate isomerase [Vicinamibacteria bacterium]